MEGRNFALNICRLARPCQSRRQDFAQATLSSNHPLKRMSQPCPDYRAFFRILGVPRPAWAGGNGTPSDLDPFFDVRKLGMLSAIGTTHTVAVNPYENPAQLKPLADWRRMDQTVFANKIGSLGSTIHFIRPSLFFNRHFELGGHVIVEANSTQSGSYPRFWIYHFFDTRKGMNRIIAQVIVETFLVSNILIIFLSEQSEPLFYNAISSPNAVLGIILKCLENWQTYFLSLVITLIMVGVTITFTLTQKRKTATGLLKYLRDFSVPVIEEVMISYSWESGVTETARGIARCLIASGLGCWIDFIKLTTGDKTAQTTRTIAHHARFVVIILTEKYVSSTACFIEILEALSAPKPHERVIVYVPERKHSYFHRVSKLSRQLKSHGIQVLEHLPELVTALNSRIVEGTEDSHLLWWQKYVSNSSGMPHEAIVPEKTQAPRLLPFRLFGHILPYGKGMINISNIWIRGDCSDSGTKALSFPWMFLFYALMDGCIIFDILIPKRSFDSSMKMSINNAPTWVRVRVGFQIYLLIMTMVLKALIGFSVFDNRTRMHRSLRPLLSVSNFEAKRDEGHLGEGELIRRLTRALSQASSYSGVSNVAYESLARSPMPLVKVAIFDFDTQNTVATNLKKFLGNLGFYSKEDQLEWLKLPAKEFTGHESVIFIPIFVFGVGTRDTALIKHHGHVFEVAEEEFMAARQLDYFKWLLKWKMLKVENCVLIVANSKEPKADVLKGLFSPPVNPDDLCISDYLFLIEKSFTDHSFASEIILQTGLRVKNALKQFGEMKAALRDESHENHPSPI
ncbi:hypothetical protein BC830DRAFT_946838 [Chytriomyces sp. MP71]|nr:hypothetical protein BC830DRAFT_946838 [Chytriomyces sp. MP71]